MYNFYDDENQSFLKDIEYVKDLYEAQVHKVWQEEYMKDLLFADYVKKVRRHQSRYDYIEGVFKAARDQIGKKKKKEREQLSVLEDFIRDDFFSGNKDFKIVKIISGGYEGYYWNVELEGFGQTVGIVIPNMNNINTKNFEHAYKGKFVFSVNNSGCAWHVQKMSYKIADISEFIREYFGLDRVNVED
jgi:hypothetical protein